MTDHTIDVTIEELSLQGFTPGQRRRLGAALQTELARLFTEEGIPPSLMTGGSHPFLNAGSYHHRPSLKIETIARHIAMSVYRSFSP